MTESFIKFRFNIKDELTLNLEIYACFKPYETFHFLKFIGEGGSELQGRR